MFSVINTRTFVITRSNITPALSVFLIFLRMKKLKIATLPVVAVFTAVSRSGFDIAGHRECRRLYSENTIPAFITL